MKAIIVLVFYPLLLSAQVVDSIVVPEPQVVELQVLISEAIEKNSEIKAADYKWDALKARASQIGIFGDLELTYMRDEMPGFDLSQPTFNRWALTQQIHFPPKLSAEARVSRIQAEHEHHLHQEKVLDVIVRLEKAYYELWYFQQSLVLNAEAMRLMDQVSIISRTKYSAGLIMQQEVLKAQIELAMLSNERLNLRQLELEAKGMLMALLNRDPADTIGYVIIAETLKAIPSIDSLQLQALRYRPMLRHDSLSIAEGEAMVSVARWSYMPDFHVGLERVTSPPMQFQGWGVSVGISIPFTPWELGRAGARTEEALAWTRHGEATYLSSKAMVSNTIRSLHQKAEALRKQIIRFQEEILPKSDQSLSAGLAAYKAGSNDIIMLLDGYRTKVSITNEYFMKRMEFETALSALNRETGNEALTLMEGQNDE